MFDIFHYISHTYRWGRSQQGGKGTQKLAVWSDSWRQQQPLQPSDHPLSFPREDGSLVSDNVNPIPRGSSRNPCFLCNKANQSVKINSFFKPSLNLIIRNWAFRSGVSFIIISLVISSLVESSFLTMRHSVTSRDRYFGKAPRTWLPIFMSASPEWEELLLKCN